MSKLNAALLVIVLIIAAIVTLIGTGSIQSMHSRFMGGMSPFLRTGKAVQEQFSAAGSGLKTFEQLQIENKQLLTENAELRATVLMLRDMETERNQLRDALSYLEKSEFHLIAAQVVSRDAASWWQVIRINRGFEDGIDVDMPVITEKGLVGKTVSVSKNISSIMLITDENCRVGARIEGTREQGICSGERVSDEAQGELQLNFLTKQAKLEKGQKVFTIGVGRAVFPAGIPIGTVQSFRVRELDGQAILRPEVDFSSLNDVFVVRGGK
ncbi:MAG: rod shape-determining protein MreC [Chthoniobacterales bacterium]